MRGRKACPAAGIQEKDEHLLVHPAYIIIIPTRQQVLTRMRGSVGYLDATDECEDVNICTSAKGRRINGGKPASSIPISTTQFRPVQIRYQKNQAPKPYVLVSTTNISTTKSAHITGTS
jgi:hypothetical protein